MKKVILAMFAAFLALGATMVNASVRTDSMNSDSRLVEDYDLIWLYPNKVTEYKNTVDFRMPTLTNGAEWGGFLDGEHTGLGTVGAYVFRPFAFNGTDNVATGTSIWRGVGGTTGPGAGGWNVYHGTYTGYVNAWAGANGTINLNAPTPENKVDIFWGNNFGDASFGVQVNYGDALGANGSTSNTLTTAAQSATANVADARVLGANLGLGLQNVGPFDQANFHAGYFMGMLDVEANTTPTTGNSKLATTLKDNGISTIELGALVSAKLDDNSSLRLSVDGWIDQNNQTLAGTFDSTGDGLHNAAGDLDETWTGKYNDVLVQVGAGCNHKVLDGKATVVSGLQATWGNSHVQSTGSTTDGNTATATVVDIANEDYVQDFWRITWTAGVEAKVASWLTARAGITRPIISRYSQVTTDTHPTTTDVQKTTTLLDTFNGANLTTFNMGFGANFENWVLDVRTNVGSVDTTVGAIQPGKGIFFAGNIVTNSEASLAFKF